MSRLTCRTGVKVAVTAVTALVVLTGPLPAGAEDAADSGRFLRSAPQGDQAKPWLRDVSATAALRPRVAVPPAPADTASDTIVTAVNVERTRAGLAPLSVDPCLTGWATSWSDQMASTRTFEHQPLDGMLRECDARLVAENIGKTTGQVETLVVSWMDSPGHRLNILSRELTAIGVGVSRASDGTWYATQEFLAR